MKIHFPKIRFFRGLAFRYSIFFLLSILIVIFIPMIVGIGVSMGFLIINAQKKASVTTNETIIRMENALLPTQMVPRTLVQALENPHIDYADIMRIARDFVLHDSTVFGTCIAFEPNLAGQDWYWNATYSFERNRQLITKPLGGPEYDYFKMDWYRMPKLLKRPVWTEPYMDKGGGDTMMCTYSTPIFQNRGGERAFIGVLTMDVSLAGFNKIVKGVSLFETGYGFLLSGSGQIIASPFPEMNNKNILDLAVAGKGKETQSAIREMLSGEEGFSGMDGLHTKNAASYISYAPVGSTGWSFGIIFLQKELFADMFTFLKIMSWMWGVSIFILLITTILITRRLTRPIVRLVQAAKKIGQGDFDATLPVRKSKDEVAQLTQAFAVMQDELRNYIHDLEVTTVAKEKIESELKVAQSIQMGMLPQGFHTPDNWEIFGTLDPAKAVGGDLYDFFYLDSRHLCLAIGDVAGKGVPASLFMMVTRTLLRAKAMIGQTLDILMTSINRELCRDNPNQMFVTFFVAIVDLDTGNMEFCNAGHNYPYIIRNQGDVHQLKVNNGLPLGIFEDTPYTVGHYHFTPHEIFVATTDGITDALNQTNDFFGEANLSAFLTQQSAQGSRELTELLIAEVKRFSSGAEQADDITILTLQYKEAAPKTRQS